MMKNAIETELYIFSLSQIFSLYVVLRALTFTFVSFTSAWWTSWTGGTRYIVTDLCVFVVE
jgi:hypothetical protein